MGAAPSPSRYSGTAIALHWVLAVGIAGSFAVGLYMTGLPVSPLRLRLYNWHKWAGMAVLALTLWRLLEHLAHRAPADPPMAAWQRRAAHFTHHALVVLSVVVPVTGWAYSSAAGFPVVVFGVLPLPDLLPADRALAARVQPWHAVLSWAMAALVIAHVAGALKHHFVDRDRLLARMWPSGA
ncbi:MAG TPA: cytochrome b [Albitalea sp.]